MGDQKLAFPTTQRSWRPRMANPQQFLTLSPQDQKDYVRGRDGNYYLNTAIRVVPNPLKKAAPPAFGTNQSSGGNLANILANKAALAPVFKIDPKDIDKRFQDYRGIMSNMPGMSTEVYDKMLKQAEDSARLNMGLAMMQAGFGAAAAAPKRGESPFSTLSRTLFQPLSAAAMQTIGAARKEKMAAQLGKLGAQRGISTAAFQAAMADETTMRKALIDLAGKKGPTIKSVKVGKHQINVAKEGKPEKLVNVNLVQQTQGTDVRMILAADVGTYKKGTVVDYWDGTKMKPGQIKEVPSDSVNQTIEKNVTALVDANLDGKPVKVQVKNANVVARVPKNVRGKPSMTILGKVQGQVIGPDGEPGDTVTVPANSTVTNFTKATGTKTSLLEGRLVSGTTTVDGEEVPFTALANVYMREVPDGPPVFTLASKTRALVGDKEIFLDPGHSLDEIDKPDDTKDPPKLFFNATNQPITISMPEPSGTGFYDRKILPGRDNAITLTGSEQALVRQKTGVAVYDKLRPLGTTGPGEAAKKPYINLTNETIRVAPGIDIGPGKVGWLKDSEYWSLSNDQREKIVATRKPERKQSDVLAQIIGQNNKPGKSVSVTKIVQSSPNPNIQDRVTYISRNGAIIPANKVMESVDTHEPWKITETIKIADADKVGNQIDEDVSVGEDIKVFTSTAKAGVVADTLTKYRYKGREIDLGDLIGTNALKGVLTRTEEIGADLREEKPTLLSPVSTDDLKFDPAKLALIEKVLGLEPGTAQGSDVVEVKIRHRAPGAPETVKSIAEYFFRGKKLDNEDVKELLDAGALQGVLTLDEEIAAGVREERPTHGPPVSWKDLKINPDKIDLVAFALNLEKDSIKAGDVIEVKTRHSLKPDGVSIAEYWYKGNKLDNAAVNKLLTTDALRGELTVDQQIEAGLKPKPRAQKPELMVNQSDTEISGIAAGGTGNLTPEDIAKLPPDQKNALVPFTAIGQPMNFTVTPGEAITLGGATYNAGQEVKISGLKYATLSENDQKIFDSRLVSGTEAGWRAGRTGDWNNAFKQYQKDTKASAPYKDLTANEISTLFGRFPGKRIIPRSDLNTQFQLFLTPETEKFDTAEKAYANFRKTGYVDDIPWNKLAYIDRRAYSMIPKSVYRKDPEQIYKAYETRLKKLVETRDKFSVPSTEDQANFSQTARMYTLLGRAKELLPETGIFEGTLSKIFANLADWVPGNNQEVELKSIFQEINSSLATFADPDTKKRMTNWRLQLVQTDMPKFTSSELLNRKSVNKAMQVLEDNLQNQFSITQQQKNYIGPGFAATLVAHGIKPDTPVDTTKYTWADPALVGRPFSTKVKTLMALGGKLFTQESFDKLSPGALVLTKVKDKPDVMFLKVDPKTLDLQLHPKCTTDRCVIQTRDGNSPAPGAEAINFNMK